MIKSAMKTYMKKVIMAVENKEIQKAEEALKKASSFIAKAATKGVIHKNTASRRISRLTRKVNALKA
jgi:small subunit ribosomal protein S20